MQVMTVDTNEPTLRAEIQGWTVEDTALFVEEKPIGMTPSPKVDLPKTILEALADGWNLLGPPVRVPLSDFSTFVQWEWWLTRGE